MAYESEADAVLVGMAQAGDAGAYAALLRRHFDSSFAVALRLTERAEDAEDACQEAFARAYFRLDRCHEPARFGGWLIQIVRHHAHNVRRYQSLRAAASLDETIVAPPRDGPETGVAAHELELQLRESLARLSPVRRSVVVHHDVDGWTHPQIAGALGISVFMSRRHLSEARAVLRQHLGAAWRDYLDEDPYD